MIFVYSEQLKPGLILAKNVNLYTGDNFNFILLTEGQVLTNSYIEKIISLNIHGVYVRNDSFEDIEVEPLLNEALKTKTLTSIKKIFTKANKGVGKLDVFAVSQISGVVDDLIDELASKQDLTNNMVEFKNHDNYTYQHCLNVSVLSILTGMSLGLNRTILHKLGMSAIFHDIGKMIVPIEIINKPGKLTAEEFEIIKAHPIYGVKQLEHLVSNDILSGIETHHENVDGTGYPYGINGKKIHLYGKIIAVCDVYDALTSERSYRHSCIPGEAIEYLMGCVDTKFDYEILKHFLKNIVAYAVGTLVKLSNGKLAVVVKNYSENIMRPLVRIVNTDNSAGENIDLLNDPKYLDITIVDGNI